MKTNLLPVKHSEFVLSRLNDQRLKGLFCDAVLIVEGEQFQVHKSFLAANSDYFLALFSSAKEQGNFVLAGVPLQGFRVLLDFIYTSSFVLNGLNVHDVHRAAAALDFVHVKAACEKVYRKLHQMKKTTHLEVQRKERTNKSSLSPTDLSVKAEHRNKKLKTIEDQDLQITSSTKTDVFCKKEKDVQDEIPKRNEIFDNENEPQICQAKQIAKSPTIKEEMKSSTQSTTIQLKASVVSIVDKTTAVDDTVLQNTGIKRKSMETGEKELPSNSIHSSPTRIQPRHRRKMLKTSKVIAEV